jgi:Tol biopolymer transport system component
MTFSILDFLKKFTGAALAVFLSTNIYAQKHDPQEIITMLNTKREGVRNMEPCWSPDGKQIAFMSIRDDNADIYVMNSDGTAQTNLTNHPGGDGAPQWSPDGSKILWSSNRTGPGRIFTMNADGSDAMELTHTGVLEFSPCWSPSGKRIAYTSTLAKNTLIYISNTDGLGTEQATASNGNLSDPIWSPDETQISCRYIGVGGASSIIINLANHKNEPVSKEAFVAHYGWSPNGTRQFFSSSTFNESRKRISKIYYKDDMVKKHVTIARNIEDLYQVNIAPDGDRILYGTSIGIFVVDIKSKKSIEVGKNYHSAKWSPDGQNIVMVSGGNKHIFTVNPDGTQLTQLTR